MSTPVHEWGRRLLAGQPRQPDRRSCGASVLVVERALREEEYARWLAADPARFAAESRGTHWRTTSAVTAAGRLQLPWPRALGTPPWAIAHELSTRRGHPQLTRWTPGRREQVLARLGMAAREGWTVPLYVGNALLPRHVVLVLDTGEERLRCYEPTSGRVLTRDYDAFRAGQLDLAGWDRPWCAVLAA